MGGVVKKIVEFPIKVVSKALSWLAPTPEIPEFGETDFDSFEKGILLNKQSNDSAIPVVYGTRMLGGTRVFVETSGTDNQYLYVALVLCEGEINDITEIRIDDKVVTFASDIADNTAVEVGSGDSNFYKNSESLIRLEPHYGTDDQTASTLLSTLSSWGTNHRLRGLAYLALRFKWNQDAFTGIPKVQAKIKGKKVVLIKPTNYVNNSGKSLFYWHKKEKISIQNILVICDDLNLYFGNIKLKSSGSSGGHNGLKDIEKHLETSNYPRLRIGISNNEKVSKTDYVLGKWNKFEKSKIDIISISAIDIIYSFIQVGIETTMNSFNKKNFI